MLSAKERLTSYIDQANAKINTTETGYQIGNF